MFALTQPERRALYFVCAAVAAGSLLKIAFCFFPAWTSAVYPSVQNSLPPVNINTASQLELVRISGIGHRLAVRIIRERQQRPFEQCGELLRVRGIGPVLLERISPYIRCRRGAS
ncbi:MAG: ComEA family DNA-binding protein [Candidatus Omnitrophota bacterium]